MELVVISLVSNTWVAAGLVETGLVIAEERFAELVVALVVVTGTGLVGAGVVVLAPDEFAELVVALVVATELVETALVVIAMDQLDQFAKLVVPLVSATGGIGIGSANSTVVVRDSLVVLCRLFSVLVASVVGKELVVDSSTTGGTGMGSANRIVVIKATLVVALPEPALVVVAVGGNAGAIASVVVGIRSVVVLILLRLVVVLLLRLLVVLVLLLLLLVLVVVLVEVVVVTAYLLRIEMQALLSTSRQMSLNLETHLLKCLGGRVNCSSPPLASL